MADLDGHRERGQIILVAAFALAVTFVALALVVNSAIFTENLASRGETTGSEDALAVRNQVEENVGMTVTYANTYNGSTGALGGDGEVYLEENVTAAVANVSDALQQQHASDGRFVRVWNPHDYDQGTLIADNASGGSSFENANGADDWRVVQNFSSAGVQARAFRLNVSTSSVDDGSFGRDWDDEFHVNLTDRSGDRWHVNVTKDGSGAGAFTVGVDGPAGSGTCRVNGSPGYVTVDLTRGTLDGKPCRALEFADGLGTVDSIDFANGDEVAGNYSLVVAKDVDFPGTDRRSSPGAGDPDDPYVKDAIYSVDVQYRYETKNMEYVTDITVAPGEPR